VVRAAVAPGVSDAAKVGAAKMGGRGAPGGFAPAALAGVAAAMAPMPALRLASVAPLAPTPALRRPARAMAPILRDEAGAASVASADEVSAGRWARRGPGVGDAEEERPGGRSGGRPDQGDVFLDGTRVGRWMSRELARQAGGPQASGTSFDPRISPAWPGALQGGVA
jgi:hypothetical protein